MQKTVYKGLGLKSGVCDCLEGKTHARIVDKDNKTSSSILIIRRAYYFDKAYILREEKYRVQSFAPSPLTDVFQGVLKPFPSNFIDISISTSHQRVWITSSRVCAGIVASDSILSDILGFVQAPFLYNAAI